MTIGFHNSNELSLWIKQKLEVTASRIISFQDNEFETSRFLFQIWVDTFVISLVSEKSIDYFSIVCILSSCNSHRDGNYVSMLRFQI
ncbi:hypothetical protein HHL23_09810 [Chryseobacterium sp. RP-3-3]|uniref:Uncharacterized protein n=1 Tax=Chryseobacterium antibioticum TaxID=2728847 RepID=A0A7Y0AMK4_9FLAO|nr:hypothetical protein [Chryseobacterium antibioticum]NML70091.1 hypothetical protein [Chryseobacterium antibioticum]